MPLSVLPGQLDVLAASILSADAPLGLWLPVPGVADSLRCAPVAEALPSCVAASGVWVGAFAPALRLPADAAPAEVVAAAEYPHTLRADLQQAFMQAGVPLAH